MTRTHKTLLFAIVLAGAGALPTLGQERGDGMSVGDDHSPEAVFKRIGGG